MVVGWDHERGYRGVEAFERRAEDADEIYTDPERRGAHLGNYGVDYVYVGPTERERYGDELADFEGPTFEVAPETGNVTVYEVDPDAAGA